MSADDDTYALGPGEGQRYGWSTETFVWKATGAQTAGAFDLCELAVQPGSGPPQHVHRRNAEAFYVLEGVFTIKAGTELYTAQPGTFVYVPAGTAHAFRNDGAEPGRLLLLFTPGGFDRYFAAIGALVEPFDSEKLAPILEQFDVENVGPPLGVEEPAS